MGVGAGKMKLVAFLHVVGDNCDYFLNNFVAIFKIDFIKYLVSVCPKKITDKSMDERLSCTCHQDEIECYFIVLFQSWNDLI